MFIPRLEARARTIPFASKGNKPGREELNVKDVHDLRRRHHHITIRLYLWTKADQGL